MTKITLRQLTVAEVNRRQLTAEIQFY